MTVQCTWKPKDDRDIKDAVSWSSIEEKNKGDIEDDIQAENCLLLSAPNAGASSECLASCQLLLSCQAPDQMQYVSVLSEAKVLEVYGHHGEYIKTVRNELIEEIEGMAVYRGDIALGRPLQVCSIKFACLRSKNEMWLYGVKVHFQKGLAMPENELKIQFIKVEQRLKEMGLELSDEAEAFKQMVYCHHQNLLKLGQEDVGNFVQVLKLLNLTRGIHSLPQSLMQNVTGSLSEVDKSNMNSILSPTNREVLTSVSKTNSNDTKTFKSSSVQTDYVKCDLENLKEYIDGKFEELSRQLWEKTEKRLIESETKLMCKIEEVESFVKPQGVQGNT